MTPENPTDWIMSRIAWIKDDLMWIRENGISAGYTPSGTLPGECLKRVAEVVEHLAARSASIGSDGEAVEAYWKSRDSHWIEPIKASEGFPVSAQHHPNGNWSVAATPTEPSSSAEVEHLKLDIRAQEALQVGAYKAGIKAGWNLCALDDEDGYQRAMASTEHVAELKRIRVERTALSTEPTTIATSETAPDERAAALIERIGTIADLLCSQPLEGELGDVVYDLLRQAAAQISSDRLRLTTPEPSPDEAVRVAALEEDNQRLRQALEPFAAMGRVMETRARVTFGKMPKDGDIACESSGEAGMGILTMGHFRDASALLPDAPGWGGIYKPLPRKPLAAPTKGA